MKIIKKLSGLKRAVVPCLAGCALASSLTTSSLSASATQTPQIASTSLCGDSYLLALAPHHIRALSWQSRHALSRASPEQKALPQVWDDLETLAALSVDAVLFGSGEGRFADKLDMRTLPLKWGEDFETVFANAEMITAYTGTGQAQISDWRARLEQMSAQVKARDTRPKILYITRSGGSAGSGTFIDSAIKMAGGDNVITTPGWVTPEPEHILSLEPDLIITSYFDDGYESVQAVGVRHKVVRDFIAAHPRVDIPGALWPCAGPGLIEATEIIAEALETLS